MFRLLPAYILLTMFACRLAAAEAPWESAAFSAKADDICRVAAALAAPKDADVDFLLDENHYTFDLQGRRQCATRQVVRFLTPKGVSEFASIEGMWSPWCEDRPQLRARVMASDGAVHELDPRSLGEAPVEQEPNIWSDRKVLRAPLPAVRPGSVAETEVVLREVQPYFAQGVVKHSALAMFYPVRKLRLIIDYPAALPLRYEVRRSDIKPVRTEKDGQVRLVFEAEDLKPLKLRDFEMYAPPEITFFPEVVFSTGKSWKDVAGGYEALVEKQMDLDAVRAITHETIPQPVTREQAAARLLTKVQQQVRYTGLEFGNATIVPQSPRDTLSRRYGDCKDQAILLTAMLRTAGFPAYLALIDVGKRADIAKDLPGLGDFNHAIVCVAGNPPIWLDPTDNYVPAGQLPLSDQGRWTLVASHFVAMPVKTPVADYHQNHNSKLVEYRFSDDGGWRVRETLEAQGACAEQLRALVAVQNEEDLRKGWEDYFHSKYRAKKLLSIEHGTPLDLAKPFHLTAEGDDAKICSGGDDTLTVSLLPGSLFVSLPYPVLPEFGGASQRSRLSADPPKDRTLPLVLPEPYVYDIVIRVTPPPGFQPQTLPANDVKQFGPVTLSRQFVANGDNVTASFHLDTGSGTLTAADVSSLRQSLADLAPKGDLSHWIIPIEYEYRGAKLLREGHWKEALREYISVVVEHADRLTPRWHYAAALLKAGFGDAARLVAQQTVAMQPKSASVYVQLARILSHDLIGRHLRRGIDRPGALAAYRKAIELDPSDPDIHAEYAILLEHDDAGRRYSSDADLNGAIREYREARKLAGTLGQMDINLPLDMFFAGDYAGVDAYLNDTPTFPWKGLLIANESASRGVEAAQRKLQQISDSAEERRVTLLYASDHLSRCRLYPQSLALLRLATSKDADDAALRALAEGLAKLRRVEEVQFPANDPRSPVQQLLVAALAEGKWEQRAADLFTTTSPADEKTAAFESLRGLMREVIKGGRKNSFPPQRIADAASLFDITVESGDDDGRRIQVTSSALPNTKLAWHVIREPQGYRILVAGFDNANLGAEALRQLDKGHESVAGRWLDWACRDQIRPSLLDSFSASAFSQLWMMSDRTQPGRVALAAAALAAEGNNPEPVVPILLSARQKSDQFSEKLQIDRALAIAYCRLHRWKELMEIVDSFQKDYGQKPYVVMLKLAALDGLERQDELRQFVSIRLDGAAARPADQETLALWGCQFGAFGAAQDVLRSRAAQGKISSIALNQLAWNAVFQEPLARAAIDDALTADGRATPKPLLAPITLALLYAEQGKAADAHESLLRSMEDRGAPPGDIEWYVLGRTAEEYGLNDIASALYGKVSPPKLSSNRTIYQLAQRRLKKSVKAIGNP